MLESLPPKTCSIERLITNPADVQRVLSGSKTATRRNGRYADAGEIMVLEGHPFEVTRVYQQRLSEMTEEDFQKEGFRSKTEYLSYIQSLHGKMPMPALMDQEVWVHEFSPAQI